MMICPSSLSKWSNRRLSLWLIAALVLLSPTLSSASARLSETYSNKHFQVLYVKGDDVRAEYVADRAEEWFDRLTDDLGDPARRWNPVPIMVYPTHDAFVGSTGDQFGERLVGRAFSGRTRVELDASEMYAPMQTIIGHELTHIFIFRLLGPRVSGLPLWANEGIAKTEAGEWDELDSDAIAQAAASNDLPRLSDLEYTFPKGNATLAYAVSASVIRYISSHTPGGFVKPMLAGMAEGQSFENSVRSVTGRSPSDWEGEWRSVVFRRYAPYGWMRTLGFIAGLAFPVLAIAAYLVMRGKKKHYVEQYEDEDGYSPDVDREYWPDR